MSAGGLALAGASVAWLFAAQPSLAATTSLNGVVIDVTTGLPVAGATVSISQFADYDGNGRYDGYLATTGANGGFSVPVLNSQGTHWDLTIVKQGYEGFSVERAYGIPLPAGDESLFPAQFRLIPDTSAEFGLTTITAHIAGTTTSLPGARVVLRGFAHDIVLGVTGSGGTLATLLPRTLPKLDIVVTRPGDRPELNVLTLTGAAPYAVTVEGGVAAREFSGTLMGPSAANLPAGDYRLAFVDHDDRVVFETTPQGTAPVQYAAPLADGDYTVILTGPAGADDCPLNIAPTTPTALNLVFPTYGAGTASISGNVMMPDPETGDPTAMSGLRVTLTRELAGRHLSQSVTTTDSNGHYSISGVPAGDYTLSVHIDGAPDGGASESFALTANTAATIDFASAAVVAPGMTEPAGSQGTLDVTGTVTDESSNSLAGVDVLILDAGTDEVLARAVTDSQGHYALSGLGDGTYRVAVLPFKNSNDVYLVSPFGAQGLVLDGASATHNVVMRLGNVGVVTVMKRAGSPNESDEAVADASVAFTEEGESEPAFVLTTDSSGRVAVGGLSRYYTITVSKSGYETIDFDVDLDEHPLLVPGVRWLRAAALLEVQ